MIASKRIMIMRPIEMERRIQLAINNSLRDGDFIWIVKQQKTLKRYLEVCRKQESWQVWDDYNAKKYYRCLGELMYISDRFRSYQRIDWLLYCCEIAK